MNSGLTITGRLLLKVITALIVSPIIRKQLGQKHLLRFNLEHRQLGTFVMLQFSFSELSVPVQIRWEKTAWIKFNFPKLLTLSTTTHVVPSRLKTTRVWYTHFFSFSPFFSLIRKFYLLNVDWAKSESAVDRMSLLIKFGSISYVIRFAVQGLARGSKSEIMICGTFSRSKKGVQIKHESSRYPELRWWKWRERDIVESGICLAHY